MHARSNRFPPRRMAILIGLIVIVAITLLATRDLSAVEPQPLQDAATVGLEIAPVQGAIAPDFQLLTLKGEPIRLSDLCGRPVMINLWATWCAPCRLEMPHIQDRYERHQESGFLVLAIHFDEPAGVVAEFKDELGLTFPILLDPGGEVQKLYRNRSYPTSFFIDERGVIQVHHIGVMTEGQLDQNLLQIGLGS